MKKQRKLSDKEQKYIYIKEFMRVQGGAPYPYEQRMIKSATPI